MIFKITLLIYIVVSSPFTNLKEEFYHFVASINDEFVECDRDDSRYERLNEHMNKIPSGTFTTLECNELYTIIVELGSDVEMSNYYGSGLDEFDTIVLLIIIEIRRMHIDDFLDIVFYPFYILERRFERFADSIIDEILHVCSKDDSRYKIFYEHINKIPSGTFTTLECNELNNILLEVESEVKISYDDSGLDEFDTILQSIRIEIQRMHRDD